MNHCDKTTIHCPEKNQINICGIKKELEEEKILNSTYKTWHQN